MTQQVMPISLVQALSNAYVPIGATLVSPEISDVIHSQSNKLGKLIRFNHLSELIYYIVSALACGEFS